MTSWVNYHHHHHHHPWFVSSSLKRKLSTESEGDPSQPRKRLHKLERSLAGLTLHHHHVPTTSVSPQHQSPLSPSSPVAVTVPTPVKVIVQTSPAATDAQPSSQPMAAQANAIFYPFSIEEPVSPLPQVPEVKMTSPSWYELEKDRIVITRLDSDDSEDESDTVTQTPQGKDAAQTEGGGYIVSPAVLNALNKLSNGSLDHKFDSVRCSTEGKTISSAPSSQALILFRPQSLTSSFPVAPSANGHESDTGDEESVVSDNVSLVDDPMDIELA